MRELNGAQECEEMPELGAWVKRQRVARQQAGLTQERLDILLEMGFEFGEEAQMTEEWEWRFDSLVELLLMRVCTLPLATGTRPYTPRHMWHNSRQDGEASCMYGINFSNLQWSQGFLVAMCIRNA